MKFYWKAREDERDYCVLVQDDELDQVEVRGGCLCVIGRC